MYKDSFIHITIILCCTFFSTISITTELHGELSAPKKLLQSTGLYIKENGQASLDSWSSPSAEQQRGKSSDQLTFDGGGSLGRVCLALWICDDCCRLLWGWTAGWLISSTLGTFWARLLRPIYKNSEQNLCTSLFVHDNWFKLYTNTGQCWNLILDLVRVPIQWLPELILEPIHSALHAKRSIYTTNV